MFLEEYAATKAFAATDTYASLHVRIEHARALLMSDSLHASNSMCSGVLVSLRAVELLDSTAQVVAVYFIFD